MGAWTKNLYEHFSNKITSNETSNDPENSTQKKFPVFVFPSVVTNVKKINTDEESLIENHASTSTNNSANEEIISVDRPLEIRLDGPYGSPSRHIFESQHAVLVATGIGVRKI